MRAKIQAKTIHAEINKTTPSTIGKVPHILD